MTTRSTPHELMATAASTPFEVVEITADDLAPDGSIRVIFSLDEDDVEHCGLAFLFALGVLSFSEARPAGVSELLYTDDDQWTVDDLVAHLRFRRGHLCLDTDYVRGRLMKTTADLAPDGTLVLQVVNRGETARRWVSLLQGHKPLAVVSTTPEGGPFLSPSGDLLTDLGDWQAVHPAKHWKPGRSAMLLAQSWGGAGGFPTSISTALDRHQRLRDLSFSQGLVEHNVQTPGRGAASKTDIMVFARDPLGNEVSIAVEGKVDEGFDKPISIWLTAGRSPNSLANRKRRVESMLLDLSIEPATDAVDALRYQLVHRAWSAVRTASDDGNRRCVFLVHSFLEPSAKRSGWSDFKHFAGLLVPGGDVIEPGVPLRVPAIDEAEFWVLWVSDPQR